MRPKILGKVKGQPPAPSHDGQPLAPDPATVGKGHGFTASASMPAMSGRGEEGHGDPVGDAEQTEGPQNPKGVGKQEMRPPHALGLPASHGGQLGPGHLLRALMLKGMRG